MADSATTKSENPYLAVVARKGRNLKKKLQNIQKVEAQLESGKELNEEQLVLLSTKPSVERALFDVEAIKTQLEEVAKEMEKQTEHPQVSDPEPAAEETAVVQEETVVVEVSTGTSPVEQFAMSTQYDSTPATASEQPAYDKEFMQSVLQAQVRKLLKTLHVCSRYHTITGTNLPPDVDYFGKCLLGMTSIGDFEDALSQSVKNATMFLDPVVGAEHEAIRGMNFVELSELIDHLAGHIDGGASADNNMESLLSALATPPPQPDINFFGTDEIIEEPQPVVVNEPEPVAVNDAPAQDTPVVAEQTEAAPKKKEAKKERKPRPDKKKENKDSATTDAAPAKSTSAEGKPTRSDKPRGDKKKATAAAAAASENTAPAANGKPEKAAREPRVKKEKPVQAENTPPPAPAKPAAPVSYSAAVAPPTAPIVSKSTKPPVPRNAAPKPTGAPKAPRAPAAKPATGEKKQWK